MQFFNRLTLIGAMVGVSVSCATGCGGVAPGSFVAGVRSAKNATLYEGLPHQMFEAAALQQELASKATVELNGYPFYEAPLALSDADEQALREIVCAQDSFAPFGGEKKCGGFHPDYCVEWRSSSGDALRVLVCFGCEEVKLCGPGGESRFDIREPVRARFNSILAPLQKNRPPRVP